MYKYLQAPDVSWNKPFKENITRLYDDWIAGSENKEYTRGGNLKAPSKMLILKWIIDSWKSLSSELIVKSFKACALGICPEGNEDNVITCIKQGAACEAAAKLLQQARNESLVLDLEIEQDPDEAENNEIIIIEVDQR